MKMPLMAMRSSSFDIMDLGWEGRGSREEAEDEWEDEDLFEMLLSAFEEGC
jgi:hypothetical protein